MAADDDAVDLAKSVQRGEQATVGRHRLIVVLSGQNSAASM